MTKEINQTPQVVTIAGSDSGGGAGVQADLKTFQAREVFGTSIIVALTAQNTLGVQESLAIPAEFIAQQFSSLATDLKIRAAKTGMLADPERVEVVVDSLKKVDFGPLVVDPVMIAKGGHSLLAEAAVVTIKEKLLPIADVITPNLPEAEVILGESIKTNQEIIAAAKKIQKLGPKNIVIKGGHSQNKAATDFILLADGSHFWLGAPRIQTVKTHGTGDTFSACIVAELAKGKTLKEAIFIGRAFVQGAIENEIFVGHGHGPLNHWTALSENVFMTESL